MNEKIKELMMEVGTDTSGKWMSIDNTEKFAELIVKECKSVLLNMINERQGDFDTLDLSMTEINEHFGVEE